MLAGRAASKAAKAPRDQRWKYLMEYDEQWKKLFGSDLRRMGLARRLFAGLSDETLNRLFEAASENVAEIEEIADMDFQGRIIYRMMRKRKFATLLPRVAADSLRAIFS